MTVIKREIWYPSILRGVTKDTWLKKYEVPFISLIFNLIPGRFILGKFSYIIHLSLFCYSLPRETNCFLKSFLYFFGGASSPLTSGYFSEWVCVWMCVWTAFHPFPIYGFWRNFHSRWVLVMACRGRKFGFDGRRLGVEN